ncbi:hypothetical protein [Raoultibacter timonensis]|uniref:hypothetical protein n=1 Tax=Raoultibacter timonensis TaxID=1907662 RepID=UPI0015E18DD1|nr:hypothetical protein [Raoultibacter timonensis]
MEGAIAEALGSAQVASQVSAAATDASLLCAALTLVAVAALLAWFERFEEGKTYV